MKASKRLWLNKDRTKVVEQGHKNAAFLLAIPGRDIPKEYEHLIKDAGAPEENKDAGPAPEDKEAKKDKEIKFGGN